MLQSFAPSMLYPLCKRILIGPALRRRITLEVSGQEHIPATGPLIVAANHLAEIDSLVLPLAIGRRLSFFAKLEYFTGTGVRGTVVRWFFTGTGQISVDRSGGDNGALDAAERVLASGRVWAVYPEGSRARDGRLHRGHTGMMRVAARVPATQIVPVAITGTEVVNPPGSKTIRRGFVQVRIGAPMPVAEVLASTASIREATDHVMQSIAALGDLEQVNEYA